MKPCQNCGYEYRGSRCPRCGTPWRPKVEKRTPEATREYWERVSRTRVRREGED